MKELKILSTPNNGKYVSRGHEWVEREWFESYAARKGN